MKLYIGTLDSGEREFAACVDAIQRQSYREFDHVIFSRLPNKQANDTLFRDFLAKRHQYALLVKVDADMILLRENFLAQLVERFRREPDLDLLSIAVDDWFSDRRILGLNAYRNRIDWQPDHENLFVDAKPLVAGKSAVDWDELAPAATHAANPSPLQAFHFGLQRGLKIVQAGRRRHERAHWRMRVHWETMRATEAHFRRNPDARLGLALVGAELAFAGEAAEAQASYAEPVALALFERYRSLDAVALAQALHQLRRRHAGWLPDRARQAWLWYRHGERRASASALAWLARDLCARRRMTDGSLP